MTLSAREARRRRLTAVMERHGLTTRAMATLVGWVTHRAVGMWASGDRTVPDWGLARATRIDTALRLARGELPDACDWDPAGRSQLELLDHLDECPLHAQRALAAVQRG